MKINFLTFIFLSIVTWSLFTSHRLDPNNPPAGKTGAPSETTCAQSGCHTGGAFAGSVKMYGLPDTVVANQTYPITVANLSNAAKAGFQLTCLDGANVKAGTISSASGVNVTTANSRQYARQSSPKTFAANSDSVSWTFNWKAPATMANNHATFYFVSLCANGDGNKTGDNVLVSTRGVTLSSLTAIEEIEKPSVAIFPTQVTDMLHVQLKQAVKGQVRISNLQGKNLLQTSISDQLDISMAEFGPGIYLVQVSAGTFQFTQKIIKN